MAELLQEHTTLIWLENIGRHWKRRDEESCDAMCRVITCSYVIASSDCHQHCRFHTASPPIVFGRLDPQWLFVCFKTEKKSWKDGNLLTTMMLSAAPVIGWRTKINNSSTMAYGLWRIAGPSAFLSQRTMLKSDKISCSYSVVNCIRLRTFWTPLVSEPFHSRQTPTWRIYSKGNTSNFSRNKSGVGKIW